MICAACNKESNNRRVCPYCFTPYPADAPQSRPSTQTRSSTSTGRVSTTGARPAVPQPLNLGPLEPVRAWFQRQTPIVRWSSIGIVIVGALWLFTDGEQIPAAVAPSVVAANANAAPMTREEAAALMKHTRETALVDEQSDELSVSYPAATFPVKPEGQVMLALQLARADEVINNRKRRIFFYAPSGKMFAQSDAVTGLTVVK